MADELEMVLDEREGTLLRAFAGGRTARLVVVDATRAAEATRRAHGLGPGATRLAAEGVIATALMSPWIKGDERITLQIQGATPRFAYMGEIDADGQVRARLTPADVRYDAGKPVRGAMLAIKADAERELYRGMSGVDDVTLEQALADHLVTSSQVDALLRIHVRLDDDGAVAVAVGLVVERLPEDPVHPWVSHEAFVAKYGVLRDADVEAIFAELDEHGRLLGELIQPLEVRNVRFRCRCGVDKVEGMLAALGGEELRDMADKDGKAEVTCHFCNATFTVDAERLRLLATVAERAANPRADGPAEA